MKDSSIKEGFRKRLKEVIWEVSRDNYSAFSKATGVPVSSLNSVLGSRASMPGYIFLHQLLTSLPWLSSDWLILNTGQMKRKEKEDTSNSDERITRLEKKMEELLSKK